MVAPPPCPRTLSTSGLTRLGAFQQADALSYFLVFIGAGIGGALRHGVNRLSLASFGPGFPWGTLFVNVAGGLVVGAIAGLMAEKVTGSQELRLFLTTGLLGGFTTFSAFSLETALMIERRQLAMAGGYVALSVVLSVAALFVGLMVARRAFGAAL